MEDERNKEANRGADHGSGEHVGEVVLVGCDP
jgi:hypothetical protein